MLFRPKLNARVAIILRHQHIHRKIEVTNVNIRQQKLVVRNLVVAVPNDDAIVLDRPEFFLALPT